MRDPLSALKKFLRVQPETSWSGRFDRPRKGFTIFPEPVQVPDTPEPILESLPEGREDVPQIQVQRPGNRSALPSLLAPPAGHDR